MLSSNPPQQVSGSLHARQRLHRRQNSTPSAFEAVKIAPLPNFHNQQHQQQRQRPQHLSHRRGVSLDTRRQQFSPTTRQDFTTVSSIKTNQGLSTTTSQHNVLREAQQQRIARPGLGQPAFNHNSNHGSNMTTTQNDYENFIFSPHGSFDVNGGVPFDAYMGPLNVIIKKGQSTNFANNSAPMASPQDLEFFASPDSALSTPTFMTFPDASPAGSCQQGWISEGESASTHSRRTSRRISNGILDKVAKFEAMGNGMDVSGVQRPNTPPNQNGYFPPTPTDTPHNRLMKHEATPQQRPNRFADGYDESMEETIKPVRSHRSSNRNSGIFQELRLQAESMVPMTPERANTTPMAFSPGTPGFMNMTSMNAEFAKIGQNFNGLPNGTRPLSISSALMPDMPDLRRRDAFDARPDLRHANLDSQTTVVPQGGHSRSHSVSTSISRRSFSRRSSPHRRTESIASIASAASIAGINIEETKTETGVTTDDIAQYMEGPDPKDGKWVCLYEDCQKRFGRKENIKSHVQTHLNDRQYQCPTCRKCFVRQHDLKRHAKIHTGIKPYPCECGNSFARHDALTRHRQRGMCIGAFDGIVRKVVKRGRPRKHRPELEDRRDKSERTRRKNKKNDASHSSSSSQSGYSDSSAVNSPSNDLDAMLDDSPFTDMLEMSIPTSATMDPGSLAVSSAPMVTTLEGNMAKVLHSLSPEHQGAVASPSAMSNDSHMSHVALTGNVEHNDLPLGNNNPASPAKSVASHYTHVPGTPPELSASSSPPPTGRSNRFFDMDPNSSGISDTSIGLGTTAAAHASASAIGCGTSGTGLPGLVTMDDMLLQFTDEDSALVQLDRDLMLGKFDDDYDSAVNMFTNTDDVFFGTS